MTQPIPNLEDAFRGVVMGSREENAQRVVKLPITSLVPFRNHPFSILESQIEELRSSIREQGIVTPLLVREVQNTGQYEIIAGHHRYEAARKELLETLPCIIQQVSDEQAVILMVDSNAQRGFDRIKPSELAKALQMKAEALKKQEKQRAAKTEKPLSANEAIGQEHHMSARTVARYIDLNSLTPDLLEMTDDGTLPFRTAATLAKLPEEYQAMAEEKLKQNSKSVSLAQAEILARYAKQDFPAETAFANTFALNSPTQGKELRVTLKLSELLSLLPPDIDETDKKEIKAYVLSVLKQAQKKEDTNQTALF